MAAARGGMSHRGLDSLCPEVRDAERPPCAYCLLPTQSIFSENMYIHILCPFFKLGCLLVVNSSLHVLDVRYCYQVQDLQTFSRLSFYFLDATL